MGRETHPPAVFDWHLANETKVCLQPFASVVLIKLDIFKMCESETRRQSQYFAFLADEFVRIWK